MSNIYGSKLDPAQVLNQQCHCTTLDNDRNDQLRALLETHPYLLSPTPVFITQQQIADMRHIIAAVEAVVRHPGYAARVLPWSPEIAQFVPGALGVFMGYDFHLDAILAKLIEINTNAGGAMINALLLHSQQPCCENTEMTTDYLNIAHAFVQMFQNEWQRQRGAEKLRCIAIVDIEPPQQYLYPEFKLFAQLFADHGIQTVIVDPRQLTAKEGALWFVEQRIDLIYNRLTDFYLAAPENRAIRAAYLRDEVVLTPHPHAHALYADKRNLSILSDPQELAALGISPPEIAILQAGIPRTVLVTADNAQTLWHERDQWFFKPFAGYGSKAVYRGDKVTRKVFAMIAQGGYIAQGLVAPGERLTQAGDTATALKVDWRNYVYAGDVQLLAARLYRGQTTNFRTAGGGFAPVYQTMISPVTTARP